MFSARRWLALIIDALSGASEVLPDDELDALYRAVETELNRRRNK